MEQQKGAVDPLYRVFVHNGQRFRTADGIYYQRTEGDTIFRQVPKVRGKSARRADKRARLSRRKV